MRPFAFLVPALFEGGWWRFPWHLVTPGRIQTHRLYDVIPRASVEEERQVGFTATTAARWWSAAERRHHAGGESMVSPTQHTRQDAILGPLHTPGAGRPGRVVGAYAPQDEGSTGQGECAGAAQSVRHAGAQHRSMDAARESTDYELRGSSWKIGMLRVDGRSEAIEGDPARTHRCLNARGRREGG